MLSPRDLVIQSERKADTNSIQGYEVPKTPGGNANDFTFPKTRVASIFVEESKRKSLIPSPSNYSIKPVTPWGGNS